MLGLTLALCLAADPIAWPSVSSDLPRGGGGERDAAVVVGISRYAFLPAVAGAAENAADWSQFFTRVRGIPVERVTLLRDSEATKERIERAVEFASRLAQPGGQLWLVFIGHGAPSGAGDDGVVLGVDTQAELDSLAARGVTQRRILELASGPASVVAVFDACFSGKNANGTAPLVKGMQATVPVRRENPASAAVLSSSPTFAGPLPGAERPAFSYVLLGALRGWADTNMNRSVSLDEAFSYTKRTLVAALKTNERAPTLVASKVDGALVVARNVAERAPDLDAILLGRCPVGTAWKGRSCERVECPASLQWDGAACSPVSFAAIACPSGTEWNGIACAASSVVCPLGSVWTGAACSAIQQSASPEATLAARVAFFSVEPEYQKFLKLRIASKQSKTQMRELEATSKQLVAVEEAYKDVISTHGIPTWSAASLYRIGSLYDALAVKVRAAPCPDDIRTLAGEVACDEYRNLIEDRAFAVEGKAVETYRTAYDLARELKMNDTWTMATLDALRRLRPGQFDK